LATWAPHRSGGEAREEVEPVEASRRPGAGEGGGDEEAGEYGPMATTERQNEAMPG